MLSEIFMLRLEEEIRVRAVSLRNGNGFVAIAIDLSGDRAEAERAWTPRSLKLEMSQRKSPAAKPAEQMCASRSRISTGDV